MRTPLTDAVNGIKAFNKNVDSILIEEASKGLHIIEELNREALLEGKNTDGNNLSPSYLNDPYFKTQDAARKYSNWKDRITPSPVRPPGVPNLYINGQFHKSIGFARKGEAIQGQSTSDIASDINRKYGGKVIGLNPDKKGIFIDGFLLPKFQKRLNAAIGLS